MPSAGLQVCVKGINHWIYTFAVQAMNVIGSRKSMHIPRALLHHMSVFFCTFWILAIPSHLRLRTNLTHPTLAREQ